jgi:site-specific DNA-methyltransferase (adenine-specific)
VYTFVPIQNWAEQWTDADLYKKYALSADEIAFIETIVRPLNVTGEADGEVETDDDE